jgi:hypothetical protein
LLLIHAWIYAVDIAFDYTYSTIIKFKHHSLHLINGSSCFVVHTLVNKLQHKYYINMDTQ